MSRTGVVRLTVELPEADTARVTVMAAERGTTKTQILREAIELMEFVHRKRCEGAELVLRWNDHCYQNIDFVQEGSR